MDIPAIVVSIGVPSVLAVFGWVVKHSISQEQEKNNETKRQLIETQKDVNELYEGLAVLQNETKNIARNIDKIEEKL